MFFDDILINSVSFEEHQHHVSQVLKLLRQHKLFANHKRCDFGKIKVAYLGHIISSKGMAADPSKIKAIVDWPMLRNIKELRGFLGLTGYY